MIRRDCHASRRRWRCAAVAGLPSLPFDMFWQHCALRRRPRWWSLIFFRDAADSGGRPWSILIRRAFSSGLRLADCSPIFRHVSAVCLTPVLAARIFCRTSGGTIRPGTPSPPSVRFVKRVVARKCVIHRRSASTQSPSGGTVSNTRTVGSNPTAIRLLIQLAQYVRFFVLRCVCNRACRVCTVLPT